jgi:hypothetical protein
LSGAVADLAELEATVRRMQERWRNSPSFSAYQALRPRFKANLTDARAIEFARSAALMLIEHNPEETGR